MLKMRCNLICTGLLAVFLCFAGCARQGGQKPAPVEFDRTHACAVCGMIVVDFPGAKAQVHYSKGRYDAFCSTLDLFLFWLQPDRPPDIRAVYVNDMGKADTNKPAGHWIDADTAYYVYGGNVMGPMGEALVPFADKKDAEAYLTRHGGRILRFNEVTMDLLKPR